VADTGRVQSYRERFLCSAEAPIDPLRGSIRPGLHRQSAPRGAAVKTGGRPPPEAARSGHDGCEHGVTLDRGGGLLSRRVMVHSPVRCRLRRRGGLPPPGAYLVRHAQESAWREEHRRRDNGEHVNMVATLAMAKATSGDWCGYWRRARKVT
jgi:hypothetical protein